MKIRNKKKYEKFVNSDKSTILYGKLPVWKSALKVGATGFIMSFFIGLFTFADQLMLVNFMPITTSFCFNALFFSNHLNIFGDIINGLKLNNYQLYATILHERYTDKTTLQDLVFSIGNLNGLGVYSSDSLVRAAVSLTIGLSDIVFVIPGLFAIGVSIYYGQALGEGNKRKAIWIWQNSFYGSIFVTFIGVIITFILIPLVTPAQATVNHISLSNLNSNEVQLNQFLNKMGYDSSFLHNGNETITYVFKNGQYQYYVYIGKNTYIEINELNLLDLNSTTFHSSITTHIISSGEFQININSLVSIWNNYFAWSRHYSILWAEQFLYIIDAGLILAAVTGLLMTILRCDGAIQMVTIITIVCVSVNIFFDFLFIYYAQIGMEGAGVATVMGWLFQFIWCVLYIHLSKKLTTLITFKSLKFNLRKLSGHLIWKLTLSGGAVFLGNIALMISDILLTQQVTYVSSILLGNTGSEYFLSIMGAALPIINLFVAAIIGLLQYTSPIFSFNFGMKDFKRFQHAFWWVTLYATVATLLFYFVISFVPVVTNNVLGWFKITAQSQDHELASATKLLQIWLIQLVAFGVSIGNLLCYLTANRIGLSAFFSITKYAVFYLVCLYTFSHIAIVDSVELNGNLTPSQIADPYTNNAMWFFMWNMAAGSILGASFMFFCSVWFIYKNVPYPKRSLHNIIPFKWITKIYQNKFLNELKDMNIDKTN